MKKTHVCQVMRLFFFKPRNSIVNDILNTIFFLSFSFYFIIFCFLFYYFLLLFPSCNGSLKKKQKPYKIRSSDKAEITSPSFPSTLKLSNDLHQTDSLEKRNKVKREQTKFHFLTL